MRLGSVEFAVGGGFVTATDMPARKVAPVGAAGVAIGLGRYFAITGNYAFSALGNADYVSCSSGTCVVGSVKVSGHEFTGGVRVSVPNSTRVTPFFTGSVGALRGSASTKVLGITLGAAENIIVGGGGFGFNARVSDHLAIQYDARVFYGQYETFYSRMTAGLAVTF
jgi:hypothetical protein